MTDQQQVSFILKQNHNEANNDRMLTYILSGRIPDLKVQDHLYPLIADTNPYGESLTQWKR